MISDTNPDNFILHLTDLLYNHALVYNAICTTDSICLRQTIFVPYRLNSKASHNNFSKFFLSSSLTANTPLSFLIHCSLIIFWLAMIILFGVIKSSYFWLSLRMNLSVSLNFTFGLINRFTILSLSFQVLLLIFVSLFPFFPKFKLFTNILINIILPPPCFCMMNSNKKNETTKFGSQIL